MRIIKAWLGATVASIVGAGLLHAPPAQAAPPADTLRPAVRDTDRVVAGRPVPVRPRTPDRGVTRAVPRPVWPSAGDKTAVRAAGGARVRVLDRAVARRAGVAGPMFVVSGRATGVRVDYSGFAGGYGGDYGSRLRLVRLPACAVTTPERPECQTMTPVPAHNDAAARTLTAGAIAAATATAAGGATVLAAAAAPAGDKGDYKATSLSSSATWQAGGSSGDFSWSYPMRVPRVPGGLEPEVEIEYSSGSVDGRTANTNNQPSWVGEGFSLSPGFIERSYKACAEDGAPKSNGIDPGDLCWAYDNATVTWNGKGGELIATSEGTWRLRNDDGTRFERLTDTSLAGGDNNGEYWKATTTDGTQYFFGRHRLPGWATGKAQTNSVWTAPVFGNNSGEPCHDSGGFADSSCQQAWRWNLDYVVDTNGNAIAYYYNTETNKYGRNVSTTVNVSYERGGYLDRIEYGLRSGNLFAAPPAKVTFTDAERCLPTSTFDCAASKIGDNPDKWPDVPWDQNCADDCTRNLKISPTFWTRKRLSAVTTSIQQSGGGYRSVDSWTLEHTWGDADIDRALLLTSIQHRGLAGTPAIALPKVSFNHVQLMNRVDRTGDDIPPFIKYRVGAIYDESGGQLDVTYSGTDCTLSDLPTPETNTRRCFPTYWQPAGKEDPIRDWFHKYVVTQVITSDRTARSPDAVTSYEYLGGAAWHFDDDDGITKTKEKTWSQWRGYGRVRVTTGGMNDPRTRTEHLYLRGMDGDRLNASGGTKDVTVADGEGGTHADDEALAGFQLKQVVYTGPTGTVHRKTVNTPWRHQTASRTRSWGISRASLTGVATSRTWTALDGGDWRQTRTDTTHDPVTGAATQVDDQGDVETAADDQCTRTTYAVNATAWIRSLPARQETVAVRCSATPNRATQLVSDERTFYDGGAFGAAPIKGDVTRQEEVATHDGTTATYVPTARTAYDGYGRPTSVTDALGQTATTAYTETAGLTTKVTNTTPPVVSGDPASAHVSVQELDPAWGVATAETDPGNLTTRLAYDALGRLATVWRPGRPTTATPDLEYAYRVTEGQIVAVTTKTLDRDGGQRASIELFDGRLRSRQTQAEGPDGGRLVTDTFYDSRGNVARTYDPYYATGAPTAALFGVETPGDVESQTAIEYDGLNRETVRRFLVGNNDTQEKWRTVTSYGGDWVAVDPPEGGTPAMTFSDARGRKTELRQYHGSGPSGSSYDATRYTYTADGKLATVRDPAGNVWSHDYDLRGREVRTVDPDKGTTTATFDDLGRQTSTTDARGATVVFSYDALGRRTQVREGSATGTVQAVWIYDTVRKGQLSAGIRYVGGQPYSSRIDAYDNLDRPIRQTITVPEAEDGLAGAYQFSTAYNLDGTVQSNGYPAAGGLPAETVTNTYDAVARPIRLASNLGTYVTATAYSATGKPLQYELSTGGKKVWQTLTWEYGTNRLAASRTDREGIAGVDRNASYTYTPFGTITSISDVSRSGADTQCFGHDGLRRLTEAWTQGTTSCAATPSAEVVGGVAPYWESYRYDVTGNRISETRHGVGGGADTTRTYTNEPDGQGHRLAGVTQAGSAGARTDSFGYDAAGNLTTRTIGDTTQRLAWNAEGELVSMTEGSKTTTFAYDANGDRLLRRDPDSTTLYLPGMELRAAAGSGGVTGVRYYTHDGETVALRTTSGVQFLSADHQDTAQLAIDATTQALTQRRFTPYGAERGAATTGWPDEKGFVGGTRDASTGLTHLGAREYDPAIGRFISVDPVLDMADPLQMNGYAYAADSPVTSSDPDGLCPVDRCGAIPGHNRPIGYKPKNPTEICGIDLDCRRHHTRPRAPQNCWGWECTWRGEQGYTPVYKPPVKKSKPCGWRCKLGKVGAFVGRNAGTVGVVAGGVALGIAMLSNPVGWVAGIGMAASYLTIAASGAGAVYELSQGNEGKALLNVATAAPGVGALVKLRQVKYAEKMVRKYGGQKGGMRNSGTPARRATARKEQPKWKAQRSMQRRRHQNWETTGKIVYPVEVTLWANENW